MVGHRPRLNDRSSTKIQDLIQKGIDEVRVWLRGGHRTSRRLETAGSLVKATRPFAERTPRHETIAREEIFGRGSVT